VVAGRLRFELQQAAEDRALTLYIFVREDPHRVVGRIALNNIVRGAMHGCTVGYGLAPDAVGYGYMTEALNEAVRIAFEDLGLHRVELNAIPRNARSIALAERCGFEREGVSRQMLRIAGVWEDHVRFVRLNDAWVGKP
jgi:ribosomal-protein-alanine N-acetyltransferase